MVSSLLILFKIGGTILFHLRKTGTILEAEIDSLQERPKTCSLSDASCLETQHREAETQHREEIFQQTYIDS